MAARVRVGYGEVVLSISADYATVIHRMQPEDAREMAEWLRAAATLADTKPKPATR